MTVHSSAKSAGTPTWVELTTPDIDSARKFYQAVFGWEYDIGGPEFGYYTTARLGQRTVAGMSGPQPGAPATSAAWSLYFASDNVEADAAQFGRIAALADPSGAVFKIVQPPAG